MEYTFILVEESEANPIVTLQEDSKGLAGPVISFRYTSSGVLKSRGPTGAFRKPWMWICWIGWRRHRSGRLHERFE